MLDTVSFLRCAMVYKVLRDGGLIVQEPDRSPRIKSVSELVYSAPQDPVSSAGGQKFEEVLAGVRWVRQHLPCPVKPPRVCNVLQGGQGAANNFLCRFYYPLQGFSVFGCAAGISHHDAVCQHAFCHGAMLGHKKPE